MPDTPNITIDMDQKCVKCGKKGACQNGLCLRCIAKKIRARIAASQPKDK